MFTCSVKNTKLRQYESSLPSFGEKRFAMVEKRAQKLGKEEKEMSHEEVAKTSVGETMGKAGTSVKEGIVSGLKGINEIETQMMGLVKDTVSETLKVTGSVVGETLAVTKEVLQGAVKAAEEVGTGLSVEHEERGQRDRHGGK